MTRIDIWDAQPIFCWAITALVFVAEVAVVIGAVIVIKEILNGMFK